jgi:hypothetical protein
LWAKGEWGFEKIAQKRAKTAVGTSEKKRKALVTRCEVLLKNKPPEAQDVETGDSLGITGDDENPHAQQVPRQPAEEKSQEEIAEMIAPIEKTIDDIVDHQRDRKRLETRVRGYTELNHITKYAVNLSKDTKPRDTLMYLRRTDINPEKGSKRSSEMAEIARDYHNDLQSDGINIEQSLCEDARREALAALPLAKEEADMTPLTEKLTESDVLKSLMEAASGKAAGINGLATEFWRRLECINRENKSGEDGTPHRKTCEIVKVLTWVYNNIEEHGMVEGADFSQEASATAYGSISGNRL